MEVAEEMRLTPTRISQILSGMADIYVETFGLPGFEVRARKVGKRRGPRQARNGNGKERREVTPQKHGPPAEVGQAVSARRKRR